MKLTVFSPVVPQSAIGRVSRLVTSALTAMGHEVVVVRTEEVPPSESDTPDLGVRVLSWTDEQAVVQSVLSSDIAVYHVGDHFPYHAGALEWLPRVPGIVCMHDYFVGNLYLPWCYTRGLDPTGAVRFWYGDEVADAYPGLVASHNFVEATADVAPMTEWLGAQALGVLTHSRWAIQRVLDSCPGPVAVASLPYEPPASTPIEHREDGSFRLLTVGHVNPNKRAEDVIRAIGTSPMLRERVVYLLAGWIDGATTNALSSLAVECDVRIVMTGVVDQQSLAEIYADADAVAALRWPCLEAASASAIESMLAEKPTVVMRAGSYEELPDDCVLKIEPGEGLVGSIREALERLVADPDERAAMARRAGEWSRQTFRGDSYAEALIDLAHQVLVTAPQATTVREAVDCLETWGCRSEQADRYIFPPMSEVWG